MHAPAALRVVEREAVVWRRLWRAGAFSDLVLPVLFLGAIGVGLGGLVGDGSGEVDGLAYLDFVTPGFLVFGATISAANESLWPVLGGMKYQRFFHGMTATPLTPVDVFTGHVAWTGVRRVLSATSFLVVAALLGGVPSAWAVLAVPAAVLTTVALSAPLTAFAATQEDDSAFPVLLRGGLGPLTAVSGVYFPVDQLPTALRPLAVLSPLWHGAELCRAATTGAWEPAATVGHVGVLVALAAAGLWWGRHTFTRRLAP